MKATDVLEMAMIILIAFVQEVQAFLAEILKDCGCRFFSSSFPSAGVGLNAELYSSVHMAETPHGVLVVMHVVRDPAGRPEAKKKAYLTLLHRRQASRSRI